jgi:methylthioribose-1-phosphate isomerase
VSVFSPLEWKNGKLRLLDQRKLPTEEIWIEYTDYRAVADAIRDMIVRGAPAIGCTAAFGYALGVKAGVDRKTVYETLRATRPTAVNLFWALDRISKASDADVEREAIAIWKDDIERCLSIGRHGARLMPDGGTVLTHCNAGALATGGYGTALGVIRAAREAGKKISVYADETRPFLQGARLTAWELARDGIPTTLITDNMAGALMARGEIQAVVVGADRIAKNGDTANKIGTYSVAVLARENDIPFYVAAPLSTVDLNTPDGSKIPIEERDAREVTHVGPSRLAPEGIGVRNPAFDVTPARYIRGIITEAGVAEPPYERTLPALFNTGLLPEGQGGSR